MVCPGCGHTMTNEEANFCGRCGAPLRDSVVPPTDDDETSQSAISPVPEPQESLPRPPEPLDWPGEDPLPAPIDLGAIGTSPWQNAQPLLHRPVIVPPGQEAPPITPPVIGVSTGFEAVLPPLAPLREEAGADAAVQPAAAGDLVALPRAAAPPAPEPKARQDAMQTRLAAPAVSTEGDLLRVAGCTVLIGAGPAPLVEVEIESGAVFNVAAAGLVWAQDQVSLATVHIMARDEPATAVPRLTLRSSGLRPRSDMDGVDFSLFGASEEVEDLDLSLFGASEKGREGGDCGRGPVHDSDRGAGGDGVTEATKTYLQAVGPGGLALAPGTAATVVPIEVRSGAVLDLADGALLAWTRGVRAWRLDREDSFPALRLTADRPALVLLRCTGHIQCLDLEPGARLTVPPSALLATVGMIDCARLRRQVSDGRTLVDYRLNGAGRVLLGAPAPQRIGA
jgi:hypothetical protein